MFDFKCKNPPHPRKVPKYGGSISGKSLESIFSDCADFVSRSVLPGLREGDGVTVCWLDGVVDGDAVSGDILRPLTEKARTEKCVSGAELLRLFERGAVYSATVQRRDKLDDAVSDVSNGCAVIVFDGPAAALSFEVKTQNNRAVSEPTSEKSTKGAKDAFVETLRTNTSLVRRRLRTPELKIKQTVVGRKSGTTAAVLYVEGVAKDAVVSELMSRLDGIDIDGLLSTGDIEEYIVDCPDTVLPQLLHTERPDTFAAELLNGRVGLIADGLPMGFLLPATLAAFMRAPEDDSQHYLLVSLLSVLRWLSLLLALSLPAVFVAVAMYHQEALPTQLLLSMIDAEQRVPFPVASEVVMMLISFELLQEAGLRLPDPVGQTVSIIGALIVGQSAVEARVVSPIAVIIVALAGIAGYTMPSQDLGGAVRVYRLLLVFAAIPAGLFGVAAGLTLIVWRMCSLESFGVPYTSPFSDSDGRGFLRRVIKRPIRFNKFRSPDIAGRDLRRQR